MCHCHKFKANLRYKLDRSLPEALKQICGSLYNCYFRILDRVSSLRRTLDRFTFTVNLLWWNPDWRDWFNTKTENNNNTSISTSLYLIENVFSITIHYARAEHRFHSNVRNDMNSHKMIAQTFGVDMPYSRTRRNQLHLDTIQIFLYSFFLQTSAVLRRFTTSIYHKHMENVH